ncbi:hypothetical protein C5167_001479 [Papaver somniferum]|uniref:Uncharacterized protein n=1 Tax=Papaver somniferum TaxID=3469 RepID=A0A4Y7KYX3_PAPSO|nr:hypothetical protein C5167_001479 [Papaver somniferum]
MTPLGFMLRATRSLISSNLTLVTLSWLLEEETEAVLVSLRTREKHKGSFDTLHIQDNTGHEFPTHLENVFTIDKGRRLEAMMTLPKEGYQVNHHRIGKVASRSTRSLYRLSLLLLKFYYGDKILICFWYFIKEFLWIALFSYFEVFLQCELKNLCYGTV